MVVEISVQQLDQLRHMLNTGTLVDGLRDVLGRNGLPNTGKKKDLVELVLGHLKLLVSREEFSEYDNFIRQVQSGAASQKKVFVFPVACRLTLQYIMGRCAGADVLVHESSDYALEDVLSPLFVDRFEALRSIVVFSVNGIRRSPSTRILLVSTRVDNRSVVRFSPYVHVTVNGILYSLSRYDRPLDISSYCAQYSMTEVVVSYRLLSEKGFCLQVISARARSPEERKSMILCGGNGAFGRTESLERIREALRGEADIESTNLRISLVCPLSQRKMVYPGRFRKCAHVQCFDVEVVLDMILASGSQPCPICGLSEGLSGLAIDEFFMEMANLKVGGSVLVDSSGQVLRETEDILTIDLTDTPDSVYSDDEPLLKNEDGTLRKLDFLLGEGVGGIRTSGRERLVEVSDEEGTNYGDYEHFIDSLSPLGQYLVSWPTAEQRFSPHVYRRPGDSFEEPVVID